MQAFPSVAIAVPGATRQPARWRLRALSAAALLALAAAPQLASAAACSFTTGNYSASSCLATLGAGDTLGIDPGSYKYLDLTLSVGSGGVVNATDHLYFVAGNTLNNAGSYRFLNDANLYDNGATGVFVNTGTLAKVGGAGDSYVSVSGFTSNGGTVNVQTGRIIFNAGGTFNAGSSFTGPGQTLITGGANFSGGFSSDGSLVLANGTYTGNGGATLSSGTVQWSAGTLAGNWQTAGGTTVNIGPGSYKYIGGTVTNGGAMVATDQLYISGSQTLVNNGSYQFANDAGLSNDGGPGNFTNNGTLSKVGGAGDSYVSVSGFSNGAGGVVNVQTGRIIFNNGASFASGSAITGPGQVLITNGATFSGALSTAGNLYLAGGTYTANNVVATGNVSWTSGTMAGTWQTASGSTLKVDGGSYKYVGGALTNAGTMVATDTLYVSGGQTLTNNGSYQFASDSGLFNDGGPGNFINNGTLAKVGGAGDSYVSVSGFSNSSGGVIDVQTGRIFFNNGASFAGGSVITGVGQVVINNGATFNGALSTANNLILAGGTFTANNVVATGDVSWTAGTMAGTWQTASGSTLKVDGGSYKYVDGTLTNAGTMAATDNLYVKGGQALVNNGSYRFSNDVGLYDDGGAGSFVNNGTLAKVGGAGDSYVSVSSFTNSTGGVIDVQTGRIFFNNGATFAGGSAITGAGQVWITNGATFNGALSTANNLILAGGTFTANNVVATGDVYWTTGTMAGTWQTASGSTLHVDGGSYKYVGGTLTNAGTMTASDNLYFNGGSALVNGGSYRFANDAGLYDNGGAGSFVNNGTLAKVGGAGDSYVSVSGFSNSAGGVIDVQSGRMIFNNGATLNSGSTVSGAGQMLVTNGATVNGNLATANNLYLNGGTVTGNNAVASGGVHFTNGTMAGQWQSAGGSALYVEGGSYKYWSNLTLGGRTVATDHLYGGAGTLTNNGRYEFANDAGIYSGTVVNNGVIVKTGGAGTSDLSSLTLQNAGTLEVQTATLRLPDNFTNNGTIMGTATVQVNGTLTNLGHLAPGSTGAVGALTLAGNLAQGAGGALDIRLASSTSSDLLLVTGTAAIDGSNLALSCFACMLQDGDAFLLMSSSGALTGTFASVTTNGFGPGFEYTLDYSHTNQVWLNVLEAGAVPEPSTYAMLFAGVGVIGWLARRRKVVA